MLVKELRNRDSCSTDENKAAPPVPSAPPADQDDTDYVPRTTSGDHQSEASASFQASNNSASSQTVPTDDRPIYDLDESDFEIGGGHQTWSQTFLSYWDQTRDWYQSQSEDRKMMLKAAMILLFLYVLFGGRFGVQQATSSGRRRGNYGDGNAYDQFRKERYQRQASSRTQHDRYGGSDYQDDDYYAHNQYENKYSTGSSRQRNRGHGGSSSFQLSDLFDGSFKSISLLGGILYLAHRNGINPMQVLAFLNILGGGRRYRRGINMRRGAGFGGFGRRRW